MTHRNCRPWDKKWSCVSKNDCCQKHTGQLLHFVLFCFVLGKMHSTMYSFLLTLQKVLHASMMGLYPVQRHRFPEGDRAGLVTQVHGESQGNDSMKDPILEENFIWCFNSEILCLKFHFYINILGYLVKSPEVYFNISTICTYSVNTFYTLFLWQMVKQHNNFKTKTCPVVTIKS